jgi:hypothetical protein
MSDLQKLYMWLNSFKQEYNTCIDNAKEKLTEIFTEYLKYKALWEELKDFVLIGEEFPMGNGVILCETLTKKMKEMEKDV